MIIAPISEHTDSQSWVKIHHTGFFKNYENKIKVSITIALTSSAAIRILLKRNKVIKRENSGF